MTGGNRRPRDLGRREPGTKDMTENFVELLLSFCPIYYNRVRKIGSRELEHGGAVLISPIITPSSTSHNLDFSFSVLI